MKNDESFFFSKNSEPNFELLHWSLTFSLSTF